MIYLSALSPYWNEYGMSVMKFYHGFLYVHVYLPSLCYKQLACNWLSQRPILLFSIVQIAPSAFMYCSYDNFNQSMNKLVWSSYQFSTLLNDQLSKLICKFYNVYCIIKNQYYYASVFLNWCYNHNHTVFISVHKKSTSLFTAKSNIYFSSWSMVELKRDSSDALWDTYCPFSIPQCIKLVKICDILMILLFAINPNCRHSLCQFQFTLYYMLEQWNCITCKLSCLKWCHHCTSV